MKMSHYKADNRLWKPIMLCLFVFLWFAPFLVHPAVADPNPYEPRSLSWGLFDSAFHGQSPDIKSTGVILLLICTVLVTGVVAFLTAWVVQFPIVIFRAIFRFGAVE